MDNVFSAGMPFSLSLRCTFQSSLVVRCNIAFVLVTLNLCVCTCVLVCAIDGGVYACVYICVCVYVPVNVGVCTRVFV